MRTKTFQPPGIYEMDLKNWATVLREFLFLLLLEDESTIHKHYWRRSKSISEISGIFEMFYYGTLLKLKWLCKIEGATENLKKPRGTFFRPDLFIQAQKAQKNLHLRQSL